MSSIIRTESRWTTTLVGSIAQEESDYVSATGDSSLWSYAFLNLQPYMMLP